MSSANLTAALRLAGAGYAIFPAAPDKRPLVKDWQTRATDDAAQIRRWWSRWPDAMPALPTGARNRVAVLDIDRKGGKDGMAGLAALGLDPARLSHIAVGTPSGGLHLYFAWPEGMGNSAAGLPPGVDIRGQGGFVIAQGATSAKGTYQPRGDGLLDDLIGPPDWPAALLPQKGETSPDAQGLPAEAWRERLFAIPNDGSIPENDSRDWWLGIGAALHHAAGGGAEGCALWHEWSALWPGYDDAKTDAAWDSFQRSEGSLRTGATITAEARRHGWSPISEDMFDDDVPALIGGADMGNPIRERGKLVGNLTNAIIFLGRDLENILPGLHRNQMTGRDEWRDGAMTDAALALARSALERGGLKTIGKEVVADAVMTVARARQRHPVQEALATLLHDGVPRLDAWLVRHGGADDSPYVRAVGRKFLIQMVARVMQPGCKADHTLVLIGGQGQNKSAACRVLAGPDYFSDTLPSIAADRTDAIRHLQGKWLVELAELAPSRKSEAEDLKAFLSGAVDKVRLPYARHDETFPRQCVFVGTTNEDEFLRDATGGRRFWPVHVGRVIDLDGLSAERDQLFAEAVAAYHAGEPWWFDRDFEAEHAKPVQEAAYESDEWMGAVAVWLDAPLDDFDGPGELRLEVTLGEVLAGALGIPTERQNRPVQKRAADVMRKLGWAKAHTRAGKRWQRPES